jgi:hypothetical protein
MLIGWWAYGRAFVTSPIGREFDRLTLGGGFMLWPYEISHFTLAEVCNIPLFDLFGGANKSIEKRSYIYNICIICLPLGITSLSLTTSDGGF